MFKSEAKLFLKANNSLNYAKTLINECKRLINEMELQGNSDYTKCKNNIINCDIDKLVNKVESTKESLMKLDQGFASEYMTLLQEYLQTSSIDTSKMSDEERMQYSVQMSGYARDYNQTLLYMLEKYEESGMLTPELQLQLEMQRTIVEQYDVQDKMAALTTDSQEYIDLFKKNAEYDKKLINLNPNLTENEKADYLKQYENSFNSNLEILELNRDIAKKTGELKKMESGSEAYFKKENEIIQLQINYYESKGTLTENEKKELDNLKNYKELNGLYIDQAQNSNFFHSFIYDEYEQAIYNKKKEMKITTPDEDQWHNMNGWERAWENTKTFSTSVVFGIGSVTEGIVDGGAMLLGGIGILDKNMVDDFVSISYTDDAYTGLVQSDCINSVSANSGWHSTGTFIGEMGATILLQFLPGGTYVMTAAHALKGMGEAAEKALNSGHSFDDAFKYGAITGTIEGASAFVLYGKTPGGAKFADIVGSKFGGEKLMSLAKTGVTKLGAGKYANEVFKKSLVAKFEVAVAKEIVKEYAGTVIGEEFDKEELGNNILKSMATTAFNELVVSPAVNFATKHDVRKDGVQSADKKYEEVKGIKGKIKNIKKQESTDAKNASQELRGDIDSNATAATTRTLEEIKYLEAVYNTEKMVMDNLYNNLSLWDDIVGVDFINKFAKKIGSEFMKKEVLN